MAASESEPAVTYHRINAFDSAGKYKPLRERDYALNDDGFVRRDGLAGPSIFALPASQAFHGPVLRGKVRCFIFNKDVGEQMGLELYRTADPIPEAAVGFTEHSHIRPTEDMTLEDFESRLASPDLWRECHQLRASAESFDIFKHFSFPKGCTFSLDIRHLFGILLDLIDSLEDAEDYIRCFIILSGMFNNPPESLDQICFSNKLFIQYVLSTYETAQLSEEIEANFDEIFLVILRQKLQTLIEAEQSLMAATTLDDSSPSHIETPLVLAFWSLESSFEKEKIFEEIKKLLCRSLNDFFAAREAKDRSSYLLSPPSRCENLLLKQFWSRDHIEIKPGSLVLEISNVTKSDAEKINIELQSVLFRKAVSLLIQDLTHSQPDFIASAVVNQPTITHEPTSLWWQTAAYISVLSTPATRTAIKTAKSLSHWLTLVRTHWPESFNYLFLWVSSDQGLDPDRFLETGEAKAAWVEGLFETIKGTWPSEFVLDKSGNLSAQSTKHDVYLLLSWNKRMHQKALREIVLFFKRRELSQKLLSPPITCHQFE